MPVQLTDSGECKVQDLDSEVRGNILKGMGINKGVNNLKIRDCVLCIYIHGLVLLCSSKIHDSSHAELDVRLTLLSTVLRWSVACKSVVKDKIAYHTFFIDWEDLMLETICSTSSVSPA